MYYGEDEGMFDPLLISFDLFILILIVFKGIDGGTLLTPLLILIAEVRPAIAVDIDLVFAAVTKIVGAYQHMLYSIFSP